MYNAEIKNLITAGRSISVTDTLWDITRVIPVCVVTGEAAGSAAGTAAENSAAVNDASDGNESGTDAEWFTVYARDGSTVEIRHAGGAMYEDAQGRTYVNQQDEGCYYCITTDITYAFDPTVWTGEIYGENEFPVEGE